jgi:hypothetical protein
MAPADPPRGSPSLPAPDLAIVGDKVTLQPSGYEEPLNPQPERVLLNHTARFRQSPLDFLREVSLHVSGTGWRAYDNVIGQPTFYKGFTENMKQRVLGRPILKDRIIELAEKRVKVEEQMGLLGANDGPEREKRKSRRREELIGSLKDVAEEMVDKMICKMESKTFLRGAAYLTAQLLTRAYHQGEFGASRFLDSV